jgi:hypothetical protein
MKTIKYSVLLFTLMFVQVMRTQTKQVADSLLGVYPLQIGNVWQYWTYDYLNEQYTWIYGWTTKIVGDTLMPDGKVYSVLKSDGGYGENGLLRQDGNKVVSYSTDSNLPNVVYDFSKTIGDTIWKKPFPSINDTLFSIIRFDQPISIFGLIKRQWVYFYEFMKTTAYTRRDLTNDIGITFDGSEGGDEWFLRGAIINGKLYGTITSVNNIVSDQLPTESELFPNYPNPFNASTTISFYIKKEQNVNISVYDLLGRKIVSLLNNRMSSGFHKIVWEGKNEQGVEQSSGVYFFRIQSETGFKQMKMLMIK